MDLYFSIVTDEPQFAPARPNLLKAPSERESRRGETGLPRMANEGLAAISSARWRQHVACGSSAARMKAAVNNLCAERDKRVGEPAGKIPGTNNGIKGPRMPLR
jgi:hypothetical protein